MTRPEHIAEGIVKRVADLAGHTVDISPMDDGGVMVEIGFSDPDREVTVVINKVGSRQYFTCESEGYRLNGLITYVDGLRALLEWASGGERPSLRGLSVYVRGCDR